MQPQARIEKARRHMASRVEISKTIRNRITFHPKAGNAERFLTVSNSKSAAHSAASSLLRSLRLVPSAIALSMLLLAAGLSPQALSQAANVDQKPAPPTPDVLTLANGDQLTG